MTPIQSALECASRGWLVFPVALNKSPRTPNGFKAASTDADCIRAMHVQFGFVLVGIRTGEASNIAVLDIDRQHDGAGWWQENRDRLPATRTHRTRSGGLHLFFQNHPGLRCSTAKIAPGIDVKAEGGSIIFWPAAGLPVLCEAPLAPWPQWLMPPPKPAAVASYKHSGPRPAEHIAAGLAGLVRTIAHAPPGQRNARLFWAAARTRELIDNGELSRAHGEAALIEAAIRAGLEHLEITRTIQSAFAGGAV